MINQFFRLISTERPVLQKFRYEGSPTVDLSKQPEMYNQNLIKIKDSIGKSKKVAKMNSNG